MPAHPPPCPPSLRAQIGHGHGHGHGGDRATAPDRDRSGRQRDLVRARARARFLGLSSPRRGATLVEILIVCAIIAVFMGIAAVGFFGTSTSRLRRGATMVSGATRLAYAHATATSKTVRLVFNFGTSTIRMEETKDRHLMKDPLLADAANEAEAEALAATEAATLRAPPASFEAVNLRKASGMRWGRDEEDDDDENPELALPRDIQFWQIDVEHQLEPVNEGLAYLYFFPGGQTENASIQLRIANTEPDSKTGFLSVLVSPLTGKVKILGGRVDAPKPRDDIEASELEDPGR